MARDIYYGRRGRINARELREQITRTLRSGAVAEEGIDASLLQHVSPIEWDNVILYGQYVLDRARVRLTTGPCVVFQHQCGRYPLKRAIHFHQRRELRDRTGEGQHCRIAGLNLLAAIIICRNTLKLGHAVFARRNASLAIPTEFLAHVSPLGWEHINLTGEYRWPSTKSTGHAKRLT